MSIIVVGPLPLAHTAMLNNITSRCTNRMVADVAIKKDVRNLVSGHVWLDPLIAN